MDKIAEFGRFRKRTRDKENGRMLNADQSKLFAGIAAVDLALCLLVLVTVRPAEAAFPGKNGKIAFVSNRDVGAGEIYTMKPNGTGATRITFPGGGNSDPAFSADGIKIAFKSSGNDIHMMNADGAGVQNLTNTAAVESEPAWSPDGSKIAFVANSFDVDGQTDLEIWTMNADGSGWTQLTNNTFPDTQPAWSPLGDKIAFVSARNSSPFDDTDRNVYVMNSDGSSQTNITPNTSGNPPYQGNDDDPTWSPDSSKIAYGHSHEPNASGLPNIWTMDANGANKSNLSSNAEISATMPAWSPDGTKLAYVSIASGTTNRDIWMMSSDGTGQGILHPNPANDVKPDWQQDSIPPQTAIISGPSGSTNSTGATFHFSSTETDSSFRCSLDGAFGKCLSPKSYSSLGGGQHTFKVRAVDAAGNVDQTPATRMWTVDTAKPAISGMSPKPGSKIRDTTPTVKAKVTDKLSNLQKGNVKLYVGSKQIRTSNYTYSSSTDTLTYNFPKLGKGKKTVKVVAKDKAGNVAAKSWSFTIR